MKLVSANTVEETWQQISALGENSPDEVMALHEEFVARQGPLVEFVLVAGEEQMSLDGRELAMYLALNIWTMFEAETSVPMEEVSPEELMAAYENREKWIESFMDADENEIERWLRINLELPQEHVARYVIECIVEECQGPDSDVQLSDEDTGQLFWLLFSIIDVFDDKLQKAVAA